MSDLPDRAQVPLNKIWITVLSKLVVVQFVMLNVPGLWKHPVEPVGNSSLQSFGKVESMVSGAFFGVVAVSTMHNMVPNHSPPGTDGG